MSEIHSKRVLFYVQHLLGIGHLMRAKRIAQALVHHGFDVMVVSGGSPVPHFAIEGARQVQLPPIAVSKDDFSVLVDADNTPIDDDYRNHRRDKLLETYSAFQPDIVVLEAYPFGRRQVRFELLPLIDAIESTQPRPKLVCSVRDILQKRVKPGRDAQTAQLISQHFDKVLVHGDESFAPLGDSFSESASIATKLCYTGLISAQHMHESKDQFDIVVSAGGGAVGEKLLMCVIGVASEYPDLGSMCVITGPNLPEPVFESMARAVPAGVVLQRFRDDFTGLLAGAKLSISQAGYNTVSDVLQARCRCLLIPFSMGTETEQLDRARRLQAMGLATTVLESELSVKYLANAMRAVLSQSIPPEATMLNTEGADNTARILEML